MEDSCEHTKHGLSSALGLDADEQFLTLEN
jgi:hypothetical protein